MTAAANKNAFKDRQAWIDAVQCRRDLSPSARMVGSRLGSHKNLKTAQCNPGVRTLASEAGIAERSAFRAIVELERKGWIKIARSRGGRMSDANSYTLIMPKGAYTADTVSAVKRADKRGRSPLTLCQPNLEEQDSVGNATHSPTLGERDEPSVLDSSGSGRTPLRGAAEPFEERPESHLEAEPGGTAVRDQATGKAREGSDGGLHAAWRALVELWAVRPWPLTPRELTIARTIFVKVVAAGTPADVILAGAGVWVGSVDEPRYLKALPQWLQAKGWEHGPPQKPKRQRAARSTERRSQTSDLCEALLAEAMCE